MKEYIERERLKEAFNADLQTLQSLDEHTMNLILIEIDEAPAADVAPVRHGRWDENGRCTLCGGHAPFWAMASTYYKSPWCHECGACMEKEAET